MKKRVAALILAVLLLLFAVPSLTACTKKAEEIRFGKATYSIKKGETLNPEVIVTPSMPYALTTVFSGIAEVVNGGIKGNNCGKTVLTATAGGLSASIQIEVILADGSSNLPGEGKVLVMYVIDSTLHNYYTNYVMAGDSTPNLILEREGYDFKGWFTDTHYKTPFDFTVPIEMETKIYGKYDVVQGEQTPLTFTSATDGYVDVTGLKYKNIPYTEISIPKETSINGATYAVRGVAENAMQGIKTLRKLSMPYVTYLGNNAFSKCTLLSDITVGESLGKKGSAVGYNTFQDTAWFAREVKHEWKVGGRSFYHGAQLGNCYIFSSNETAVYLNMDETMSPQVTVFAAQALYGRALIYVPKEQYSYYYSHENLKSLKAKIRGYYFNADNQFIEWLP